MKLRDRGFTLVELLIGMSILVFLALMAIAALNPQALVGKANDTRRKSDLSKIKKAFEEYFNDKGYYPVGSDLANLNTSENCGSAIFSPYLAQWPCDPSGNPYVVSTDENDHCFKVMAGLENKKDSEARLSLSINGNEVSYGVSSSNILWYENGCGINFDSYNCDGGCYIDDFGCNDANTRGCDTNKGEACYRDSNCGSACRLSAGESCGP